MLTSKQRAFLRAKGNALPSIFHIGKSGITPELSTTVGEALEARELIKVNILENCSELPRDVAETLAGRTRSEVVQVIGKCILLYRCAKKPQLVLPV